MRILDRYLVRQVLIGSLMALLALLFLDVIMAFIREATKHSNAELGTREVFLYLLYTLPRRLYDYSSTGVLIGSMLSLGALAANSELIAMRAAGVSVNRLVRSVLKAGALLALFVFVVGEFVAPVAELRAESIRLGARAALVVSGGGKGLWFREGDRFIRVHEVLPNRSLRGVRIWRVNPESGEVQENLSADRAWHDPDSDEWVLEQVVESRWQSDRVQVLREKHRRLNTLLDPNLFRVLALKPELMSMRDLSRYSRYLRSNHLDDSRYRLAFWTRLTTPLSSLVMLMVAMPFVFSSRRSGGFGQQLFLGIVIGVVFFLLNRMLNHVGLVYHLPPLLAATLPLLMFAALAVWGLRRIR